MNAWDDFFNSSIAYTPYTNENNRLEVNFSNSYYVSYCLFIYLNHTGAVRISDERNIDLKILIETSSFDKCGHESDNGGSLFVYIVCGDCIQNRLCSFGSSLAANEGVYCYIGLSLYYPFKNYLQDSTITSSYGSKGYASQDNIRLDSGDVLMKTINISYPKNIWSGFYRNNCYDSSVSFSTFLNASENTDPVFHQYGNDDSEIQFCHFLKNVNSCLIYSNTFLQITNCSFCQNYNSSIMTYSAIGLTGCYFDIQVTETRGHVGIDECVNSMYPDNHLLSEDLCFAGVKREFSEEKENEELLVINKRNNRIKIFVCLIPLIP